jgi:curved DNA-binding protein
MDARREPDCRAILQVDRHAQPLVITRVYRLLTVLYHPDNKEKGDTERFRQVMEAARVLSDPVRRAAYDRAGRP